MDSMRGRETEIAGDGPAREMQHDQTLAEINERELPDASDTGRSEEHTSELQSQSNLVCRHLLEKKNNRRSLLLVLRLLWKTPIFPSNSMFPRLCAKCLLKLKRLVSILPMTKSKK